MKLLPLAAAIAAPALAQDIRFPREFSFPHGDFLSDVHIVDVNQDGRGDVISASVFADTVNVRLTDQLARPFQLGSTTSIEGLSTSLVIADFNGDDIPDIAAAGFPCHILISDGAGGFSSVIPIEILIGDQITAADFDRDGVTDLAATFPGDQEIRIVLMGAETPEVDTYPVGDATRRIEAADVNGDNRPDLVTANFASDDVSVLFANTDGTFAPALTLPTLDRPQCVTVADINNDGVPDILVGSSTVAEIDVYPGGGAPRYAIPVALNGVNDIKAADLNNDGLTDLVTANTVYDHINLHIARPDGSFEETKLKDFSKDELGVRRVAIGDIDGDAVFDIAFPANDLSTTTSDDMFALVQRPYDLNTDGAVNSTDLAILITQWGNTGVTTPADYDLNGSVLTNDLADLISAWKAATTR